MLLQTPIISALLQHQSNTAIFSAVADNAAVSTKISIPSPLISTQTSKDVAFHEWCDNIGIAISPAVRIVTSDKSVAGRGVFAIDDIEVDEVIARIPTAVIFHPDNCAECFPQTATRIAKSKAHAGFMKRKKHTNFGWIHNLWQKVIIEKRRQKYHHLDPHEQLWQPELTLYALDAVREGHPWGTWISQWQRDDPTYRLFCSNANTGDEDLIDSISLELKRNFAPYLNELHIKAALLIRLLRLEEERQVIPLNDDSETSGMYALLGSRAVAIDDDITGVIPFHDMINHSLEPNLSMTYTPTDHIEIYANRKIDKGQELFLCYTKLNKTMNSVNALWALVQWGIPTPAEHLHDVSDDQ